ncbi:MAG: hypothetical protein OEV85_15065, partial [Candidatus Thorarchaeota archaeon]|nr:hypothetical protein [Candidatus Thorarchaeota archaeon]
MIHADATHSHQKSHLAQVSSYFRQNRRYRKILFKSIVSSLIILAICTPISLNSIGSNEAANEIFNRLLNNQYGTAQGGQSYSSSGNAQQFSLQGVITNTTQDILLLDPSTEQLVSISAPQGWTGTALSGSIEHLSTQVETLKNGLLDDYHSEHHIMIGLESSWNSETYYVPDSWSLIKNGDLAAHPKHGQIYWQTTAGAGREGSMGWRPSVLMSAGNPINPNMELYLSQSIQLPWREVYSCEVRFYHRVPSGQVANDIFYLFVDVGGYREKLDVFSSGYVKDKWVEGVAEIPASVFANMPIPGAASLAIGIGTDFSGNSPYDFSNLGFFIDQIEVIFEARPFPEQIGLTANNTIITGLTQGNVSPYVPDGASRDCYDHYSTGISTSQVRVGVYGSTGWTVAGKYQVGMQFPLNIPQGATISSAR